jgi:uncharacterized protein (DUF488 family)
MTATRKKTVVFTIGYERRTGPGLIRALRRAGVRHLADVRRKPVSRRAEFRAGRLQKLCDKAGIEYGAWSELGATDAQRARLKRTGDLEHFLRIFRRHAEQKLKAPIARLARRARRTPVALLCYERKHAECHRSVLAAVLKDRHGLGVSAIE